MNAVNTAWLTARLEIGPHHLSTTLASSRQGRLWAAAGGGEGGHGQALMAMRAQDRDDELHEQVAPRGGDVPHGAAAPSRGKWPPRWRQEREGDER